MLFRIRPVSLFLLASHWLRSALCLVTPPRVLSLCRLSPSSGSWVSSRLLATNSGRGRDGGGSGDPKEQQKADLARLALERIWGGDSGAAGNGPLPLSSIEGAEEAALAVRSALLNGKRGLVVDVDVSEFDTSGRGFDSSSLFRFLGSLARSLALAGKVKVIFREKSMAEEATSEWNRIDGGDERVVWAGLFNDAKQFKSMDTYDLAALSMNEIAQADDGVFVLVEPKGMDDMTAARRLSELAEGRPILLFNPRMRQLPGEFTNYVTAYAINPYVVIPVKKNPRAKRANPLKPQRASRSGRAKPIYSDGEVNPGFLPKVVRYRNFPAPWQVFVNADGSGLHLVKEFEREPTKSTVIACSQTRIDSIQRSLKQKQAQRRYGELRDSSPE